jgi:hypothetical protein
MNAGLYECVNERPKYTYLSTALYPEDIVGKHWRMTSVRMHAWEVGSCEWNCVKVHLRLLPLAIYSPLHA